MEQYPTSKTNPLRIHDRWKKTSIKLPDTITQVRDYEFNDYDELTTITIPESVTSIDEYDFFR